MIRICMYCQQEQELTPYLHKATKSGVKFTHGMCEYHYAVEMFKTKKSKAAVELEIKKIRRSGFVPAPHLKKRPDLVNKYKNGIFDEPVV
jgi:hypothetical protein